MQCLIVARQCIFVQQVFGVNSSNAGQFVDTNTVSAKLDCVFINPNTSLHSVVFLSTFRSDCAAFIRMTNGRLAETGTFKVFFKKLALVKTSHNKLKVQKK